MSSVCPFLPVNGLHLCFKVGGGEVYRGGTDGVKDAVEHLDDVSALCRDDFLFLLVKKHRCRIVGALPLGLIDLTKPWVGELVKLLDVRETVGFLVIVGAAASADESRK